MQNAELQHRYVLYGQNGTQMKTRDNLNGQLETGIRRAREKRKQRRDFLHRTKGCSGDRRHYLPGTSAKRSVEHPARD